MNRQSAGIAAVFAAVMLPLGAAFAAEPAPSAKKAPECEQLTATRIQRTRTTDCIKPTQPTRTITKEELDSTGQADLGQALKRLDPRFR